MTIVWEDAGSLPFSYDPEAPPAGDTTLDYSKKLATFRPGSEFAMCAKGWIHCAGRRSRNRTARLSSANERATTFASGSRAATPLGLRQLEVGRKLPDCDAILQQNPAATSAPMTVVGLIDDGMFEARIQTSAALLAEMLWNPNRDEKAVLEAALTPIIESHSKEKGDSHQI